MINHKDKNFDVVVIGAGVAGIAAGYYLTEAGLKVALIDRQAPMSFTSAQSGENYRNWWPHPTMTAFTNRSIKLMEDLSGKTDNCLLMSRRGYLLASRGQNSDVLINQLYAGYGAEAENKIRLHGKETENSYQPPLSSHWEGALDGVDVIQNDRIIREYYPYLDPEVTQLIHIRRAGSVSFHPLGQFMLSRIREGGGQFFQGAVTHIDSAQDGIFTISFDQNGQLKKIWAQKLVNAAGPFTNEIAQLLGTDLPIKNIMQQKIAFEDNHKAIPRDMPFTVDLDDCTLDWGDDKEILAEDKNTSWLTEPIKGGIHCRPDGGEGGRWIKLGWAFNNDVTAPSWTPELNPLFPDLVLRGASRLNPALKTYLGRLPRNFIHYGGYYSMTDENWPIIGPMGVPNAYVIGALSGFGTMAACGAGELITAWITGAPLPDYAALLSLNRYQDTALMTTLKTLPSGAL